MEKQSLSKVKNQKLNIKVLRCANCGDIIPDHEKYPAMMQMNANDIECIHCEMLALDSSDLDNSFGSF